MRIAAYLVAAILSAQTAPRDLRVEKSGAAATVGRSWAVVIGVSQYKYLPPAAQLRFAHRDAEEFAAFLATPDGGSFPASQVRVITNERATIGALRATLHTWLVEAAGPNDRVYVFFAGHGVTEGTDAYLLSHDADPQNLYATALSVQELDELVLRRLKTRNVVLFADACHSGYLGWSQRVSSRTPQLNRALSEAVNSGSTLSLLGSRAEERSYESDKWGGGHGAFSYYLLEGLRGKAELQNDQVVRAAEIIAYLSSKLPEATGSLQHPQVSGHFDPALPMASMRFIGPLPPPVPTPDATAIGKKILSLISAGRVVEPGGAWDYFVRTKDGERKVLRPIVQQALEDIGQLSVSDYVQSTAAGLKHAALLKSAEAYARLKQLQPDDPKIESKRLFCLARARILENRPLDAVPLLEKSIRLDPKTACPYAALGSAYEKLGDPRAAGYFAKAAELAPDWALPHLQMAGQKRVQKDVTGEIEELQRATDLNPQMVLAHWRLGSAYRAAGNYAEAERALLILIQFNANYAPAYYELGLTYQSAAQHAKAVEAFDTYLQLAPNFADSAQARTLAAQSKKALTNPPAPRPAPRKAPSLKKK